MNIQHLFIGLFFTTSVLTGAASEKQPYRLLRFKTIKSGSLLDQFIQQPEKFEAGLGADLLDPDNKNLPLHKWPTREQLERRIMFCKEIKQAFDQSALALLWACAHKAPLCCSLIVSAGLNPNVNVSGVYNLSITPLCIATHEKNATLIKKLLSLGAKVDYPCESGEVPLHFAVTTGCRLTILRLLIEGANPNAQRADGISPLSIAAAKGFPNAIKILLKYNADPNLKTYSGTPPICLAAACTRSTPLQALIEGGAKINKSDADKRTALHIAAEYGKLEHVQLLLNNGADVHAKRKDGKNALFLAAEKGHSVIAKLLLDWSKKHTAI
jgi:ankyrin repeat protein